jgi:hypothetical protein
VDRVGESINSIIAKIKANKPLPPLPLHPKIAQKLAKAVNGSLDEFTTILEDLNFPKEQIEATISLLDASQVYLNRYKVKSIKEDEALKKTLTRGFIRCLLMYAGDAWDYDAERGGWKREKPNPDGLIKTLKLRREIEELFGEKYNIATMDEIKSYYDEIYKKDNE